MNLRNMQKIQRGDELALTSPVDNLYNPALFSLEASDTLIGFSLLNNVHPFINILPKRNTNIYRGSENMLTYIAPDGTAADTPTGSSVANPCEPGNSVESGHVSFLYEGFTRSRRSTPVRDITDRGIKYVETQPIYDIAGNLVEDDFEWDAVRLSTVVLQDLHRLLLNGNSVNPGETAGMLELIDYGYTDPVTAAAHPEMDSYVIDWNSNSVCDFTNGAPGITYNGVAVAADVAANTTMIDVFKSYVRRVSQRITMSTVNGAFNFVSLLDPIVLGELIDCYVCYTVCGSDVTRMDSFEARRRNEELRSQLGRFGAVTLTFDGWDVLFMPYTWSGLYDSGTGEYTIITIVPQIGTYPVWELQFKDMANAINGLELNYKDFMVTDTGRFLHWSQMDHTCYQRHTELQFRLIHRAPFTSMKITGISVSGDIFGRISHDPLSAAYLGGANLVSDTPAP